MLHILEASEHGAKERRSAEWDGWTIGLVREYVIAMASHASPSSAELLEAVTEKAGLEVISAKQAAARAKQDQIARYEAHPSRMLLKVMHKLEALQTRRLGGSAPLAHLDVGGLAKS